MKQAKSLMVATGLGLCLSLAGCTSAPVFDSSVSGEPATEMAPDVSCETDCADGDANRYQYYLGILSVLIMG